MHVSWPVSLVGRGVKQSSSVNYERYKNVNRCKNNVRPNDQQDSNKSLKNKNFWRIEPLLKGHRKSMPYFKYQMHETVNNCCRNLMETWISGYLLKWEHEALIKSEGFYGFHIIVLSFPFSTFIWTTFIKQKHWSLQLTLYKIIRPPVIWSQFSSKWMGCC